MKLKLRLPQIKDIKNKTVMVRVDLDVPLVKSGSSYLVADDLRLRSALETIKFLQKNQAKIILIGHLGRPGGKVSKDLSLQVVAAYLKNKFDLPVTFVDDCVGEKVTAAAADLRPGEILLLENLRFYPQEQKNDPEFAQQLAALADVYINESFATTHRAHASITGIPQHLPSFSGFHLKKEVEVLHNLMTQPQRPLLIVVGGAKISDKIGALENLLDAADGVLVGGGVANNFLKAEEIEIHKSYLQDTPADLKKQGVNFVQLADELIEEAKTEKMLKDDYVPLPKILYPLDVIAAASPDAEKTEVIDLTHDMKDTPDDKNLMYLDIGPKTTQLYKKLIAQAGSVFWNGPMGYFEKPAFAHGTREIAQSLAKSKAMTIAGGGDTVDVIRDLGLEDEFDFISIAGGASLAFLAGENLSGLRPLQVK